MLFALSTVCVVAAAAIMAHITAYLHRSAVHGTALIKQERRRIAAGSAGPSHCHRLVNPAAVHSAGAGSRSRVAKSPGATGRPGAAGSRAGARGRGAAASPTRPASTGATAAPGGASVRGAGTDTAAAPRGLLEAPRLRLVAPVQEGTTDAILDDAVGHVTGSAWPGVQGTAVFAAHDVTWFSRIDLLRSGDAIRYVTPCHTYIYRVTAHRVVHAGYPIYNTPVPTLILDTCYPLDALYPTHARYLVYAKLATAAPTHKVPRQSPGPERLTLLVPPALAAQGLSLDQNRVVLGAVRFPGAPSPQWRRVNGPLDAAVALAAYFGMIRSAEQQQNAWWAQLAPAVRPSSAGSLWGGEIIGYDKAVDLTLRVRGGHLAAVTLSTALTVADAAGRQGVYWLTVTETVSGGGRLLVSGFSLTPARR